MYSLDDFEEKMGPVDAGVHKTASPLPSGRPSPPHGGSPGHRGVVTHLDPKAIHALKLALSNLWHQGWRHRLALYFGGMCAHAGVPVETATDIVSFASDSQKGDTRGRVKDVEDTYSRFQTEGQKIAGRGALEEMLNEFPPDIIHYAKNAYDILRKAIPKPVGRGSRGGKGEIEPDFEIIKIIKFDSRPACYQVTIQKHGDEEEFTVECETPVFTTYNRFLMAFIEATPNKVLAPISNRKWHLLIEAAPAEIKDAPEEARIEGAIQEELHTFLQNRKENPDVGELRAYAGYNDEEIYFLLSALKGRLRDNGTRPTEQRLINTLKSLGWEPKRQQFGDRMARIWAHTVQETPSNGNGNGHGNGNGNRHPTLFPDER